MERVLSRRQAELGQRDEFLRDLFHGRMPDAETAMEKARSFGWDLGGALLVVVARLSDESGTGADPLSVQAVVQLTRSRLRAFFPKTVYTVMTKDLVFSSPSRRMNPRKTHPRENPLVRPVAPEEFSREFGLSVAVAAGGRAKDVMDVPRSYEEALHVAGVQPAVFPGEAAVFWESIGEYRILSLMSQNPEAERLCADVLGPLLDESAPSSRDLLETLRMLDACNWNVRDVSARMRFHYNTIKYRSARIREILKIDPDDPAVRFRIGLALRLLELLPDTMRFVKK
jgi:sugar diacid utilization regulator